MKIFISFYILIVCACVIAYGGVKGSEVNLTETESEILDTALQYNETGDISYITIIRDKVESGGFETNTLPIIYSKIPVNEDTLPLYLEILQSDSSEVSQASVLNRINNSPAINEFNREQLQAFRDIVDLMDVGPTDYALIVSTLKASEVIDMRLRDIEVVTNPSNRTDISLNEKLNQLREDTEPIRQRISDEISPDKAEFLSDFSDYNATKSKKTLAKIIDFYNNPPSDYDPSLWIATRIDVNADSISLILDISEVYFEDSDILLDSSLGRMVLHIVQSGYLEQADIATRGRFLSLLEEMNSISVGEIHGFSLNVAQRAVTYIEGLPRPPQVSTVHEDTYSNQISEEDTNIPSQATSEVLTINSSNTPATVKDKIEPIAIEKENGSSRIWWILGAVVLILAAAFVLRKKKGTTIS